MNEKDSNAGMSFQSMVELFALLEDACHASALTDTEHAQDYTNLATELARLQRQYNL